MQRERHPAWYLKYYLGGLLLLWTLIIGGMLLVHLHEENAEILQTARIEAGALYQRDLAYLRWNSRQGGIYVPVSGRLQPNPRLAFLPGRDVVTADGRTLTLVNPVFMARQVYAMEERGQGYGGHLTGRDSLHPAHAPDAWEAGALGDLAGGAAEVSTVVTVGGEESLRMMRPFPAEASCRKCHREGAAGKADLGALSLTVPLAPLQQANSVHQQAVAVRYALLWMAGAGGLGYGFTRLRRQIAEAFRSAHRLSEAERSVNFLTYYDPLTSLPNRQLFNDRLRLALVHARRLDQQVAVVQLALDNVQRINGSFGHTAGDRLLRDIAARLTACLRPDDSVARCGPDRFLVLLPDLRLAEDAAKVLEKVRQNLEQPFAIDGREFYLAAHAGIALFPADGRDAETLVRNAETALHRSRELGRGGFSFYAPVMNTRAVEQLALDSGLHRALELGQMEVHYQPQIDAASGRVLGAEALLRWRHPEYGVVAPGNFIPLAEDSGVILGIGRWVLETACAQAVAWREATGQDLHIAVNLSPRQLQQPDLMDMVEEILARTGLPPQALEIEITEGTLIDNFDQALGTLTDLKVRGVRIAIDDFGTGYSSLAYLIKFPIDRLKIDRTFIADLEANEGVQVVIRSIVDMTDRMAISLLAEGVETVRQRDFLLGHRCSCMQGFLFGRAMPAMEFDAFLAAR